jgi:hypothetical protein
LRGTLVNTVTPISIKEAAARTGKTPWEIYQLTERGLLPCAHLRRVRFVTLEDVLELQARDWRAAS